MLSCLDCIKRTHPDDPRIPVGPYHQTSCDYFCDKPTYYRELETPQPPEQIVIHRTSDMTKQEYDLLQQLSLKVNYLLKKVTEKQSFSKKEGTSYNYIYSIIEDDEN